MTNSLNFSLKPIKRISESEQELEIQLEIFSGSASGSEEYELCESSGDADCESGYPMDYEVVDENFSKVGVDRGTSGIFMCLQQLQHHDCAVLTFTCWLSHYIATWPKCTECTDNNKQYVAIQFILFFRRSRHI